MEELQFSRTGYAPFRGYQTWYKIFGFLHLDDGKTPLIAVHGGPGAGCGTLEVLEKLWTTARIPVIVYDQIGCGRSSHAPDEPRSTWTIEFFLGELSNLITHLRLAKYNLLGHSWGGMLALEHAVRQPAGLQQLIIEGSPASMELCMQVQHSCFRSLGEKYYEAVLKHDRDGTESEDWKTANDLFLKKFMCRTDPIPQCVIDCLKTLSEAYNVTDTLWGTEKTIECTGTLKDWTIIPRLHLIRIPVLVLTGEYDYCGGKALDPFLDGTIDARLHRFPDCGHMAHIDAGDDYINAVASFSK